MQAAFYLLISGYAPVSLQMVFLMPSPQQAKVVCTKKDSDAYPRSHSLQEAELGCLAKERVFFLILFSLKGPRLGLERQSSD